MGSEMCIRDRALAAIPNRVDGQEWGKRLLIRTDSAGGSQAFLRHLNQQGLAYSVGLPVTWQIGDIASTLGEGIKQGIIRAGGTVSDTTDAYVADITSRMRSWAGEPLGINLDKYPTDMRIIIRSPDDGLEGTRRPEWGDFPLGSRQCLYL